MYMHAEGSCAMAVAPVTDVSMAHTKPRYTPVKRLANGSTASVFLAQDTATGDLVVLKRVARKSRTFDLLATEMKTQTALSAHPGVAKLLDVVERRFEVDLVMEYCPGGELFDAIEPDVGMKENEAVKSLAQVAETVRYMHDLGYVHRDIKPENLCLTRSGDVKLIDFGAAVSVFIRKQSTYAGTVPYIAPECLTYSRGVAPDWFDFKAVDVWALGTVAFVIFTGKFPWSEASLRSEEFRHYVHWCEKASIDQVIMEGGSKVNGETATKKGRWEELAPDVRELLFRTLQLDPKRRWTMAEVCVHIEKMLEARGISARSDISIAADGA